MLLFVGGPVVRKKQQPDKARTEMSVPYPAFSWKERFYNGFSHRKHQTHLFQVSICCFWKHPDFVHLRSRHPLVRHADHRTACLLLRRFLHEKGNERTPDTIKIQSHTDCKTAYQSPPSRCKPQRKGGGFIYNGEPILFFSVKLLTVGVVIATS